MRIITPENYLDDILCKDACGGYVYKTKGDTNMPKGIPNSSTPIATIKEMVPNIETKFLWLENDSKNNRSTNCQRDVSIRLAIKARDKKTNAVKTWSYCFTLRNETGKKFKFQYVDVAVFKNRLYFRPSSTGQFHINTYKLSDKTKCNGNFSIVKTEKNSILEKFIGDYDLKYDEIYELFYIETNAKVDS